MKHFHMPAGGRDIARALALILFVAAHTWAATAQSGEPDLVVKVTLVPTMLAPGMTATIEVTVANRGTAAAGPSTTEVYLSRGATLAPEPGSPIILVERVKTPALEPSSATSMTIRLPISAQIACGMLYVVAAADAFNEVAESNEDNNTGTIRLTLPCGFSKVAPPNGAIDQPVSLTLSWTAYSGATQYQYRLDRAIDSSSRVSWTSAGTATNARVTGLAPDAIYYWHVRAVTATGFIYANGSPAAYWSFSTGPSRLVVTTPSPLPDGIVRVPYELALRAAGGAPPYAWTTVPIACIALVGVNCGLPPGISLTPGGVLLGMPTRPGKYSFHVRVTDTAGQTAEEGLSVTVRPPCSIILPITRRAVVAAGAALSFAIESPEAACSWFASASASWIHVDAGGDGPATIYGSVDRNPGLRRTATIAVGDQIFTVVQAGRASGQSDFTGDLKSDLMWRHATGGDIWLWPMDGSARQAEDYVRRVADTNWEVRGAGNQDGDSYADLLWRNKVTGDSYYWPMNGPTPRDEIFIATVDPAYDIVGTGDFNGDGKSDILWRHLTNGEVWIWLMDGATPLAQVHVDRVDPAYEVRGVGDLDGDGRADIVWHHATAGEVWAWLMDGTTRLSATWVGTVADVGYQIAGVADFTGDGKGEILWHHATTGEVWLWRMDGATRLAETWVGTVPDAGHRIVGAGDYNGDGKADILWHHAMAGEVWVWMMDGATRLSETWVGGVPDVGYRVVK
jgi:hypothetical protein